MIYVRTRFVFLSFLRVFLKNKIFIINSPFVARHKIEKKDSSSRFNFLRYQSGFPFLERRRDFDLYLAR